jgi:uncharacterized protein YqjF (DUF2071 family)
MRWHDLLFMHWPVPADLLRPLIPAKLELDTFDGRCWVGVVPFRMSGIRARFMPPIPGTSAFAELNVRTYVTAGGKPGVWFFSLDSANTLAVRAARRSFNLPYFYARMKCAADASVSGGVDYASTRTHRNAAPAEFAARYRPTGPAYRATPGSLEHFLTERYCLYSASRRGDIYRGEIAHAPWPLQPAEADIECNRMLEPVGLPAPNSRPLLHYAHRLDVVAWRLDDVGGQLLPTSAGLKSSRLG